MSIPEEVPLELLNKYYERQFASGGHADHIFSEAGLEESRKTDIADTFGKLRGSVQEILKQLGIEDPNAVDHMTMVVAVEERSGFESGVKYVYDNADVVSPEEAYQRASVMHNMKTAGF
ncbi:MAG: hypothetical protein JWL85_868 [Candidatus Saccharibacteria bacterium]|nr:hypothetical protein [Candidatus Saccharibacteria bacterium]